MIHYRVNIYVSHLHTIQTVSQREYIVMENHRPNTDMTVADLIGAAPEHLINALVQSLWLTKAAPVKLLNAKNNMVRV